MHPEITRELMRAQHEELERQFRRPAARHAAARPGATTHRARRSFRWALRHAGHLTHGAH
jgi:hypothetical protein